MQKVYVLACLFLLSRTGFGQAQFLIGVKGGMNGCFYMFNTAPGNALVTNTSGAGYTKITSSAPSIPALLELIYGTKKFRIGYQFEYERILTARYNYKYYNVNGAYSDTAVVDQSLAQHFICNNLLIEYVAWDDHKHLRLVPDFNFGYFLSISSATEPPYDVSQLSANRFKIGVALNLEYYLGPYYFTFSPDAGYIPIQGVVDPTSKGYMLFLGLNVGIRFNVTQKKQQSDSTPNKKKKKEYVNPEDEE